MLFALLVCMYLWRTTGRAVVWWVQAPSGVRRAPAWLEIGRQSPFKLRQPPQLHRHVRRVTKEASRSKSTSATYLCSCRPYPCLVVYNRPELMSPPLLVPSRFTPRFVAPLDRVLVGLWLGTRLIFMSWNIMSMRISYLKSKKYEGVSIRVIISGGMLRICETHSLCNFDWQWCRWGRNGVLKLFYVCLRHSQFHSTDTQMLKST